MSIGLLTDSAADLPAALIAEYGITVVPLEVHLGDAAHGNFNSLTTEEFFRRIVAENLRPKTSQPPVGLFIQAYRELLAKHESVVAIHMAGALSGTYEASSLARQSFPGADITVLDSGSVSLGLGLQVLQAARAINAGLDKEHVLALLERIRGGVDLLVSLDTIDFLYRGGRIGKAAMFLGSLLKIKPLVRVYDGQVLPFAKVRNREQALEGMLAWLAPLAARGRLILGVAHTTAAREAEALRQSLQGLYGMFEIILQEAGPVLGTHAGPRALAIAVAPC